MFEFREGRVMYFTTFFIDRSDRVSKMFEGWCALLPTSYGIRMTDDLQV